MNALILFVAQGFGTGRIPKAPGTFGTLVGVGWFALLNSSGHAWVFGAGALLGLAASVWLCGRAESLLGEPDPGSVVLDEIAAFPLCFALPVMWLTWKSDVGLAPLGQFYHQWPHWLWTYVAFRVFRQFKARQGGDPRRRESRAAATARSDEDAGVSARSLNCGARAALGI